MSDDIPVLMSPILATRVQRARAGHSSDLHVQPHGSGTYCLMFANDYGQILR